MDLTRAASVGGFFALSTAPVPEGAHRPLARLYAGDTAPLTARIDTVAARLRAPERRVAASIAHLGLAARLWSVALGPAALSGRFPDIAPGALWWDPGRTSPDDLRLPDPAALPGTAERLREAVQYGHLVPLADAMRRGGNISRGCCGATRAQRSPVPCANSSPGRAPTPVRTSRSGPARWRPNSSTIRTCGPPGLRTVLRSDGAAAACTTAARTAVCAATASSTRRPPRAETGGHGVQLLSSNSARMRLPTGTRSAVSRSHTAKTISMPWPPGRVGSGS